MSNQTRCQSPQEGMRQCPYCGWFFWPSQKSQIICGDAACVKARQKEYNANKIRVGKRLVYNKKNEKVPDWGLPPKRRCVDCGRPTDDYRCSACWSKYRDNVENVDDSVVENSISEYPTGGRKTFHE